MDIHIILYVLIIAVAIIENMLFTNETKWYLEHGIVIYYKKGQVPGGIQLPVSAEYINSIIPESKYIGFKIIALDENKFALKEVKSGELRKPYTPLMHGFIKINPYTREAEFKGFLNALPVSLMLFVITIFTQQIIYLHQASVLLWLSLLFMIAVICIIYLIQSKRYNGISEKIINQIGS